MFFSFPLFFLRSFLISWSSQPPQSVAGRFRSFYSDRTSWGPFCTPLASFLTDTCPSEFFFPSIPPAPTLTRGFNWPSFLLCNFCFSRKAEFSTIVTFCSCCIVAVSFVDFPGTFLLFFCRFHHFFLRWKLASPISEIAGP